MYPDTYLLLAQERMRDLIAEADQERLLAAARRARRNGRNGRQTRRHDTEAVTVNAEITPVGRDGPASTVDPCGPAAA